MSEEEAMQNEICLACNRIKSEHQSGPLGEKIYCGGHLSSLFHPSGNVSVPASFIDKVRALEDAYKKYIDLLCEELNELTGIAFVHGWKSSRVEAGAEARFMIADKSSAVREALAEIDKGE